MRYIGVPTNFKHCHARYSSTACLLSCPHPAHLLEYSISWVLEYFGESVIER